MKQVWRIFSILAFLLLTGTLGFHLIEKWSLFDSLYMSVITLTTVGYREVNELSPNGKLFVILYLVVGMGAFFYEVAQLGELVVSGQLGAWLGKRRMDTMLKSMRHHYIVCGFGRLGKTLCQELALRKLPFVVVDKDPAVLGPCHEAGWPSAVGDATEDKTLQEAGIEKARGLATVLSSDAENLYVVLSARLLSKGIRILSRAATEKDAAKLVKAGANRVISLYATGATKMAQLLANPNVDEFMEVISARGKELDLAEVQVAPESSCAGKPLAKTDFRKRGIVIVGIRRPGGDLLLLPGGEDMPRAGDYLIALGKTEAIESLIKRG